MTLVGEIYEYIDSFAPFAEAMGFDNVGLLAGDSHKPVETAVLALDITLEVVEEAQQAGAQLIVSHHPVIFAPLRRLSSNSVPWKLASCGISAICAHTNLDMAFDGGVNDALSRSLLLKERRGICPNGSGFEGIVGEVSQEMSPAAFAAFVKASLGCGGVRFVPGKQNVTTVGLCSGAGADCMEAAVSAGANAFVTGEVKHHQFLLAKELGITLVEAGHFYTENVVIPQLTQRLREKFPEITWVESQAKAPEQYC